jgi:serine/threonine-protein kinase RsbW
MKATASPLLLASGPGAAARLHAWLDATFAAEPVPERLAHAIRLCLEEAVMNVAMHAYGAEGGPIEVALWRDPAGLAARVTDSAAPFDPTAAPAPSAARNGIEDGPLGGRGLLLMRRFAAELDYARVEGRNELTLRFAG